MYGQRVKRRTQWLEKTGLTAGTVVQLIATDLWVKSFTVYGLKTTSATVAPTNNGTELYVGFLNTKDDLTSVRFAKTVTAGGSAVYATPPENAINLRDVAILPTTTGDGVFVEYEPVVNSTQPIIQS